MRRAVDILCPASVGRGYGHRDATIPELVSPRREQRNLRRDLLHVRRRENGLPTAHPRTARQSRPLTFVAGAARRRSPAHRADRYGRPRVETVMYGWVPCEFRSLRYTPYSLRVSGLVGWTGKLLDSLNSGPDGRFWTRSPFWGGENGEKCVLAGDSDGTEP